VLKVFFIVTAVQRTLAKTRPVTSMLINVPM